MTVDGLPTSGDGFGVIEADDQEGRVLIVSWLGPGLGAELKAKRTGYQDILDSSRGRLNEVAGTVVINLRDGYHVTEAGEIVADA